MQPDDGARLPPDYATAIEVVRLAFPDMTTPDEGETTALVARLREMDVDEARRVLDAAAQIIVGLLQIHHAGSEAEALQEIALAIAQARWDVDGPESGSA